VRIPPDRVDETPPLQNGHARPCHAPAGVPPAARSDTSLEYQP
jgi:hypothetical protein